MKGKKGETGEVEWRKRWRWQGQGQNVSTASDS